MLKLLNLKGTLAGSAVLETSQKGTRFELRFRCGRNALQRFGPISVYLVSESDASKAECDGTRGRSDLAWAGGLIIADSAGDFISEGLNGLPPETLEKTKSLIRFKQAETAGANNAQHDEEKLPRSAEKEQGKPPGMRSRAAVSAEIGKRAASPVTERILDSARALFGSECSPPAPESGKQDNGSGEGSPPNGAREVKSVPNPFPRLLPGVRWRLASDGKTLEGTAMIRGMQRKLTAIPNGAKLPDAYSGAWRTRIRGRDGKVYIMIVEKHKS